MPELPEVQTTVNGINRLLLGKKITDVWTDYYSTFYDGKDHIKSRKFFEETFRGAVIGAKIKKAERYGKNVLISLSNNKTILVHMKMTGHLLYGKYKKEGNKWIPLDDSPLSDSFNRFIHLIFSLSDTKSLALSDMRKFAKVTIFDSSKLKTPSELLGIGLDFFDIEAKKLEEELCKRPNAKIKEVLMDQSIVSGIGNIYSDEILWTSGISPIRAVKSLSKKDFSLIYRNGMNIFEQSIKVGGDSMSDYRNIFGEKGGYQNLHKVYRKTGEVCSKKGCSGIIKRIKVGGRSTHYCPKHQK